MSTWGCRSSPALPLNGIHGPWRLSVAVGIAGCCPCAEVGWVWKSVPEAVLTGRSAGRPTYANPPSLAVAIEYRTRAHKCRMCVAASAPKFCPRTALVESLCMSHAGLSGGGQRTGFGRVARARSMQCSPVADSPSAGSHRHGNSHVMLHVVIIIIGQTMILMGLCLTITITVI